MAKLGLGCRADSSLRSTTSEETSAGRNPYDVDEPIESEIIVDKTDLGEKEDYYDTQPNEAPQEGSLVDNLQFLKFLEEFDIKVLLFNPVCCWEYIVIPDSPLIYWLTSKLCIMSGFEFDFHLCS